MIHRDSIEFTTALALGAVVGVSLAYLLSPGGGQRRPLPRLVARTRAGGNVEVRLPGGSGSSGRALLRHLSESRGTSHGSGNGRRG